MIVRLVWNMRAASVLLVMLLVHSTKGIAHAAFLSFPFLSSTELTSVTTSTTSTKTDRSKAQLLSPLIRRMTDREEDELSKLIDKRSQIKRRKKESDNSIEERLLESIEPTVDLDLDSLPAFKTERPNRRSSKDSRVDKSNDEEENSSTRKIDSPIVDYMADYEDENEWHIPNRLAVTSIAWGDSSKNFVSSGKLTKRMLKAGKFVAGDVVLGVTDLLQGGVTVVETSPSYGDAVARAGKRAALDILKQCIGQQQQEGLPESQIIVQLDQGIGTKANAIIRPGSTMVSSLEKTLQNLDESIVTVFLAPHVPYTPTRLLAAGLAAQIESGQAEFVGVSGISSPTTLRRLSSHLQNRDCSLTAAAFDFALTNAQKGEKMIDACKVLNVVPLITNPLDGGLASGVFTATNPSGGQAGVVQGRFSFSQLERLQPLHSVLETVSERVRARVVRNLQETQDRFKSKYGPPPSINTDITTTQVSLQWVIAKGGVPVPEVNSPAQAKEVLGCLGWTLMKEEVEMLDAAVALCKI